jgi:hypothetical protein
VAKTATQSAINAVFFIEFFLKVGTNISNTQEAGAKVMKNEELKKRKTVQNNLTEPQVD